MAITTQDALIAGRGSKRQGFAFARTSIANQAAGTLCSLYRAAGGPPAQPAIPTTAALPDDTLSFVFTNPSGADTTYLDTFSGVTTGGGGVLMTYDRLFHIGGLNGTLTTAQAVNSQTVLSTWPVRGAPAVECEWFLENYSDTGATATTATVAVTYSDATTGTVSVAVPTNWRAGRLLPIPPPQGKYIASVQSVALAATTGAAGNFGVTAGDRKSDATLYLPQANLGASREAVFTTVPNDMCFWHVFLCTGTSTGDIRGEFSLIQG